MMHDFPADYKSRPPGASMPWGRPPNRLHFAVQTPPLHDGQAAPANRRSRILKRSGFASYAQGDRDAS
jgi:hypothetical protein